jgi:NADP-dependent 3-hydroxy acid dehydrogenase YdfG
LTVRVHYTMVPGMHEDAISGRVAVITGASSGIGLAVARELHRCGAQLVLTARRAERLASAAAEMSAQTVTGDLATPGMPAELLRVALSRFGRCDVVVNNAGIIEVGPIESIDIERVCAMVRINVEAAFRVAYTFLRHFRQQGSGHLVNISSVMGTKVRPTAGAYAGTKHAIEAFSEALRMEVAGSGAQITCIEPGLVLTELHQGWPIHPSESMKISQPLQAEDVARCVRFALCQPPHVRIPRLMVLPGEHVI